MTKVFTAIIVILILALFIQHGVINDSQMQIQQLSTQNNALWGRVEYEEERYEKQKAKALEACERVATLETLVKESNEADRWNFVFRDTDPVIMRLHKD